MSSSGSSPQNAYLYFCSIFYSFGATWRKLVHFAIFLPKIRISLSQQPEVVKSRVIAHINGFFIANTIE